MITGSSWHTVVFICTPQLPLHILGDIAGSTLFGRSPPPEIEQN